MFMIRSLRSVPSVLLFLLLATAALGAEVRVATLNCLLLFDPTIDHRGKVDDEQRMTPAQYSAKLGNLANLLKGYEVVGLQETGGQAEIAALAARCGMSWLWSRGNDTATGEEVGFLHKMPGWTVTSKGRVPALDRVISKHLLVHAQRNDQRILFLVLHLLRPMGNQSAKHQQQLAAVGDWMRRTQLTEPKTTLVVLGDMNNTHTEKGTSLFSVGAEAGEQVGFAATHLANKAFDRLVLFGPGKWSAVEIRKPPFENRPAAPLKRVWTDHFLLGATLVIP